MGGGAAAAPEVAAAAAESLAGLDWPHAMMHLWTPNWIDDPVRLDRAERYIRTSTTPRQARRLVGTGADVAVLEAGLQLARP